MEEINTISNNIGNHEPYEALYILIGALLTVFIYWSKSYFTEKGKNQATKEDIAEITQKVEEVKSSFVKERDDYKKQMSIEIAKSIEPLKSQLAKDNILYQIKYSVLHQKRVDILVELYSKMRELQAAMFDWTKPFSIVVEDPEQEEKKREERANVAWHTFRQFFELNRPYFSTDFIESIEMLVQEYWDKGWEFGYKTKRVKSGQLSKADAIDYMEKSSEIANEMSVKLPEKCKEIENEIRKIIGIGD